MKVVWEDNILSLTFKGNRTYEYQGVSNLTAEELLASPSIGKFIDSQIINHYPWRKEGENEFHQ